MTKFEEEFKRPANGPLTELNNNMQEVFSQYRKMRQYADYLEYNSKKKDEEFQELLDKYSNLNDHYEKEVIKSSKLETSNLKLIAEGNGLLSDNVTLTKEVADLKSQLQQQALPVVPECVGEFVSGDENDLSKADRIAYLLKSVQGDSYYLTEELPGDGTITVDEGQDLYNWAICQHHETILKLWNGYQVEKPQLFYLKNKLTTSYLALDINTGYYEHWGEEIIPKLLNKQGYKSSFTQQEIDSMHAESYEQIEVEK